MESKLKKGLAWAVHLFTASGLIAGFMALLAITDHHWRSAALWLIVGLIIDGIDGTFARWVGVEKALPGVSGKMIDYVVDFANYAIIPAYFIYEAALLPEGIELAGAIIILLVSALYYGVEEMVSKDFYFLGFPVLWNLVAFYFFFVFIFPPWINFALILIFAILHFVPIKFLYPSRAPRFRLIHLAFSALAIVALTWIIIRYPALDTLPRWVAIACMIYFFLYAMLATWGPMKVDTDAHSPQRTE